jgi:hypothetical protein
VAQVPGDGRWVITPDRPSHFNLTTFVQWKDHETTERKRTRIMLQGMTDRKADALVPLAKSWLQAPKMQITSDAFAGGSYDQSERAYMVEKTKAAGAGPCTFVLEASKASPLHNPAFIIRNWGSQPAACSINGKKMLNGEEFRQGIRKRMDGEDLILWIPMEREKPVQISISK